MLRLVIIMLRLEISKQFTSGSCNAWSTHLRLDQAKGVKFAYFATFYAWFPCHSTPGLLIWWKENIRLVYAVSDAWFTCCYQADNFVQEVTVSNLFNSFSGQFSFVDDGIDVDSEEENEIMKEIKAEISKQMREEMKSELEVYKEGMEALEQGTLPGARGRDPSKEEEGLEDMEPKLREAILKMRKLDRILTKKVKREKEVKRDRLILERR